MYTTTLVSKEEVAEDTILFRFQKPEGFTFVAGQAVDLTLVDPIETDAKGNMREYSLCSAPEESTLAIVTRMRNSAYKHILGALPLDSALSFEGPYGSFSLHDDTTRPAVFLAGGIGISPFRSIILDAAARNLSQNIFLLYSNRRPKDAPFLDELQVLQLKNQHLTCALTITNSEDLSMHWNGQRGRIDAAMLAKYISQDLSPTYYLAGPQAFVVAMRKLLTGMGVGRQDIRFEEFSGY
jgi:ferredoxin-NADP reductase